MSSPTADSVTELKRRYQDVMKRAADAAERSGRRAEDVLVVAVTKFATPEIIRALVDLGHADFGESRVQQLAQRAPIINEFLARKRTLARALPDDKTTAPQRIRWHMIGHLQRNKVKQVVPVCDLVHSVDSLRLAEELHNFGARTDRVVDMLIQVNMAGEEQKSGIAPPAVVHLAEQIDSMMHLRLRGMMMIAPQADDPESLRPLFQRTRELFDDIKKESFIGRHFNILSMGMTDDFEVAIEQGANVVRVGRAIFGDTPDGEDAGAPGSGAPGRDASEGD